MINGNKSERRWLVRQLLIAVNLMLLGIAYYMDATGIKADVFINAMNGFQAFTALAFGADYMSVPKENKSVK